MERSPIRPRRTRLGRGGRWRVYYGMYYVYIIYSEKLNKKYVGYSTDLKQRMGYHNGKKSSFTSRGVPWKLVYYEAFLSEADAKREELFLKSGKGRERIKFLLQNIFGEVA